MRRRQRSSSYDNDDEHRGQVPSGRGGGAGSSSHPSPPTRQWTSLNPDLRSRLSSRSPRQYERRQASPSPGGHQNFQRRPADEWEWEDRGRGGAYTQTSATAQAQAQSHTPYEPADYQRGALQASQPLSMTLSPVAAPTYGSLSRESHPYPFHDQQQEPQDHRYPHHWHPSLQPPPQFPPPASTAHSQDDTSPERALSHREYASNSRRGSPPNASLPGPSLPQDFGHGRRVGREGPGGRRDNDYPRHDMDRGGWDDSAHVQVRNRLPEPRLDKSYHWGPPEPVPYVHNHRPVNNIAQAGNAFTGTNYGTVNMEANDDSVKLTPEFLKISFKADYMYDPHSGERALRRTQCTPGTRTRILESIILWATNFSQNSESVFWLSGQAGAGKSTIAYTISHKFETTVKRGDQEVSLGGSFFCSRQFPETRIVAAIIRTIVYHLSLKSQAFAAALKKYGKFETINHGPKAQLMALLVEPWKESAERRLADGDPMFVISVDAVDELEDERGAEFLAVLFDVVEEHNLSGLKFFITSRSEPALVRRITSFQHKQVCRLEEVSIQEGSADIALFLRANLGDCANSWQMEKLVSEADGLFIYAATVVDYLKGRALTEQASLLNRLLAAPHRPTRGATAKLDNLYLQILEGSLVDPRDCDDPSAFRNCLLILHTLLCAIERASTPILAGIINEKRNSDFAIDAGIADGVVRRLHPVLHCKDGKVMWFHKSFPDFVFDENRSQRFHCDQQRHHRDLAEVCFRVMKEHLRFNIADIPSSYRLDYQNAALQSRVVISGVLRYACESWCGHLVATSLLPSDPFLVILDDFLQLRILFWLEAMNLLRKHGNCEGMLRQVQTWFAWLEGTAELAGEWGDLAAFAAYHGNSGAASSTPHLYISSLATFPLNSKLVQRWRQHFEAIPIFLNAQATHGQGLATPATVKSGLCVVAVSPNSATVAVGSTDGSIRVFDLSSGEDTKTLKGHTGGILSVAYSPDGTHVVSSSHDDTVRVWNLSSGEVLITLNYAGGVRSVAYSPDGTRIVSSSFAGVVRVWDASSGEEVGSFDVVRHTGYVFSTVWSPNGTHIVSTASSGSILVWDLSSGEVKTLKGHTGVVTSATCSPHGTHVASGSSDGYVRVWDLSTGEVVKSPKGLAQWVSSVAFSPDGTRVIAGSRDCSVLMWDLSGRVELMTLVGHTSEITSVDWSSVAPGTRFASGSRDGSVRVWDISPKHTPRYIRQKSEGRYNGWLMSPSDLSAHLMFVPQSANLADDSNIFTIPRSLDRYVDFTKAKLGTQWAECYTPKQL